MMTQKRAALICALALACLETRAFGATSATNTNTVSPTLKVTVTILSAIQLTLATGTTCSVTGGSGTDYAIAFGNVDALAITTPACGNKYSPATPGATNAVYYSDYTLTPMFTSQSVSTNSITAYVSTNFAKATLSVVQASSAPANIGSLTAMSTSSGAQTTVATNATSGTAVTRYIGVSIAPTNGASVSGADSAVITYTLTAQ